MDVGHSIANMLMKELGTMQKGVMQLSSDLRSMVEPISKEKASKLIGRLQNDVKKLVARHEALIVVSSQINRAELLDLVEARLDTTDKILDYIELTLQETEGLEPVKLSIDDMRDISGIGEPKISSTTESTTAIESPKAQTPRPVPTAALPPRTPAASRRTNLNGGFTMVTPARPIVAKRKDDSLPPTPKMADFGLTDLSLARITDMRQAFAKNVRIGNSENSKADAESNSFFTSASHILHEDTSPAVDDDANDMTYEETISKQMRRMDLHPWELGD